MLSEQQLQIRSKGIGASESPALVGCDPYRSPLDIYLRKMGLAEDVQTFHTKRGQYLEPALLEWASDKIGIRFMGGCPTLASKDHPLALATCDGMDKAEAPDAICEIKAPGPRAGMDWGDTEDDVPDRVVIQLNQQMLVTGARVGYVAALIDGDLRTYKFEKDTKLEGEIAAAIESFWAKYIATKTPPPVDGSPSADAWLKRRFPRSLGEMVIADSATEGLLLDLKETRATAKVNEAKLELLEQRIKEVIADKDGITCPWGKVTYRNNKDVSRTKWEALALSLKPSQEQINQFTETKPGPRVFRVSLGK